jgi:hypothetical protein
MLEIQTFYFLGELFLPEIHPFYRFTLPPFSVSIQPRRGRDALAPEKAQGFLISQKHAIFRKRQGAQPEKCVVITGGLLSSSGGDEKELGTRNKNVVLPKKRTNMFHS